MEEKTLIEIGEIKATTEDIKEESKLTEEKIEVVEQKIQWTQQDINNLYSRLSELEQKVSNIELTKGDHLQQDDLNEDLIVEDDSPTVLADPPVVPKKRGALFLW